MKITALMLALLLVGSPSILAEDAAKPPTAPSPRIVAEVTLLAQGGVISATPLTVLQGGLYRVTTYWEMYAPDPNCAFSITPYFQWKDETNIIQKHSLGTYGCWEINTQTVVFAVHGISGTPLEYAVFTDPQASGSLYNWYMTVERVQ